MTFKQWQKQLDKSVKDIKNFTEPLKLAAYTTTAKMGERIFDEGKTQSGQNIGSYSTKPIYVSLSVAPKPKGAPTGKSGKSKFKDGKGHKSKYFDDGYKGYRDNVGRQTGFVDLSLTGELRMDFGNQKQPAEPRKINDFEYQIRLEKSINQDKREGADEKYGAIFTPSESEKELFFDTIQFEFQNRISKSIGK